MPREADPFWSYVEVVENNKRRCIFCRNECAGGATRIKAHLAGVPGYGIKGCERVDDHVREEALKAIKGKIVSDPSHVGGTSGEGREMRSGGQPSCHGQTGSDAAAIHPQHYLVLPPHEVSLDDLDICCQFNQSHRSIDAEHRNEITLSLQRSSVDWLASLSPDTNPLPQLFDQSVNLDIGKRQQQPRASSSLQIDLFLNNNASNVLHESTGSTRSRNVTTAGIQQRSDQLHPNLDEQHIGESISHSPMLLAEEVSYLLDSPYQPRCSIQSPHHEEMHLNDQQTPAGASSFQYDQLPNVGNSNFLQDRNQPLPSCNEECRTEISSFPRNDSVGIYPLIALQPTEGPHIFEPTNVDSQVLEGGANVGGPSSSQVQPALVPPQHQSVPHQSINHKTRNAQENPIVPSSSWENHLVTCLPQAQMDMDPCSLSSSKVPNNAPPPPQIPPCGTGLIGPSSSPELDMNNGAPMRSHPNTGNNFEENGALKRKLKRLYNREADIRDELEFAASLFLKKQRMEVVNWLANVENLRNDFHSIEAMSEDCLPPHQQVDILMREAEDLMTQGKFPKGLFEVRETKVSKLLERKLVGEAFQKNTTKILEYLVGNHISRLGIYGMGGVGKTTIMVHIHNRLLEKENYGNVLWITVSQDFNTQKLQDDIWKELGLGILQEKDERKRAAILSDCLTKRGKSTIILDDVWEHFDLEEVGIPIRVDGFKLVLTTRSFDVCCQMHCQEKIKIEPLAQEEAESLFLEELGSEVVLNSETKAVAKSIIEECAGLPLGVITMARSMRGVTDMFEWKDSLVKLRESEMGQTDMEKKVLMNLKFSYDRLGNHEVQQCFLSCALYPEDKLIDKLELIEFFIDQGLLGGLNMRMKQYDRGFTILNKLENVCLLEDNGGDMKMHDLIRDMALHIMSAISIVKAGKGLMRIPPVEYWTVALEKVSLMENDIREFPLNMSPNCPRLSTFLLNGSLSRDAIIPNSFFKQLCGLKFLNLSGCRLRELPNSISDLVNLRALLLRECRKLRRIPYLGRLGSLRKLDASGCVRLEVLEGLEMLVNLRYLNLTDTRIERLPKRALGGSANLQYLKVKVVNGDDIIKLWALETLECYFENVDGFNKCVRVMKQTNPRYYELIVDQEKSLFYVKLSDDARFGNWERSVEVDEWSHAIVSSRGESIGICILIPQDVRTLTGKKCDGTKILSDMSPLEYLEELDIEKWKNLLMLCGGQDEEVIDIHDFPAPTPTPLLFPSLRILKIYQCPKLKYLFGNGSKFYLPHLQEIRISHCEAMVGITATTIPPSHPLPAFPSLEVIFLYCCDTMKRVVESEWWPHFSKVRHISVRWCENLEEIIGSPPPYMPFEDIALESLLVHCCDKVGKLFPLELLIRLQNLQSVEVKCCKGMVEMISEAGQSQEGSIMTHVHNTPISLHSSISLPKLKHLFLCDLPRLKSICEVSIICDSMEIIQVYKCPRLNKIPLQLRLRDVEDLPYIYVDDEEKWKTLIWDDPNAQAIFQPHLLVPRSTCVLRCDKSR